MLVVLPRSSAPTEKHGETTKKGAAKGTVEKITVHGKSLEGNLEGDAPDRDVSVYRPPSYASDRNRRYRLRISCTATVSGPRCTSPQK
jgi:hypothetical protein